jgi:hypothetical protein
LLNLKVTRWMMRGASPLVVNVEQGDYTLSVVEGDTVTNDLGALQPGQTISGIIAPDRVDFYDIQASPEAQITVTFQGITDSRNAPRVDLVGDGFDGNDIETEEEDKGITVYVLDEDPPYRLAVAGEGSYTLSWSGGGPSARAVRRWQVTITPGSRPAHHPPTGQGC